MLFCQPQVQELSHFSQEFPENFALPAVPGSFTVHILHWGVSLLPSDKKPGKANKRYFTEHFWQSQMTTLARICICMTITSILLWEMKNQNYRTSTPHVPVNFIKQWQHYQHSVKQVRLTVRDQGRTVHTQLHLGYQRNPHMNCPAPRLSLCTPVWVLHPNTVCSLHWQFWPPKEFFKDTSIRAKVLHLCWTDREHTCHLPDGELQWSECSSQKRPTISEKPSEAPDIACLLHPQPAVSIALLSEVPFPYQRRKALCAFLTLTIFFNHLQLFSTPVAIRLVPNINAIKPITMHHLLMFIHPEITATHTTRCWKLTSSCLTSPTLSNTHNLTFCFFLLTQLSPPNHRLPLGRGLPVSGRLRRRVAGTISGGRWR